MKKLKIEITIDEKNVMHTRRETEGMSAAEVVGCLEFAKSHVLNQSEKLENEDGEDSEKTC